MQTTIYRHHDRSHNPLLRMRAGGKHHDRSHNPLLRMRTRGNKYPSLALYIGMGGQRMTKVTSLMIFMHPLPFSKGELSLLPQNRLVPILRCGTVQVCTCFLGTLFLVFMFSVSLYRRVNNWVFLFSVNKQLGVFVCFWCFIFRESIE